MQFTQKSHYDFRFSWKLICSTGYASKVVTPTVAAAPVISTHGIAATPALYGHGYGHGYGLGITHIYNKVKQSKRDFCTVCCHFFHWGTIRMTNLCWFISKLEIELTKSSNPNGYNANKIMRANLRVTRKNSLKSKVEAAAIGGSVVRPDRLYFSGWVYVPSFVPKLLLMLFLGLPKFILKFPHFCDFHWPFCVWPI